MSGPVGMGTVSFGSNVWVFRAEDGITESGPEVPVINCTPDNSSSEEYTEGDVVDHGTVSAVIIDNPQASVRDLVGTSDTLTITYKKSNSASTTAPSLSGPAILVSAPKTTGKNTLNTRAVTFQWKSKPTEVLEA